MIALIETNKARKKMMSYAAATIITIIAVMNCLFNDMDEIRYSRVTFMEQLIPAMICLIPFIGQAYMCVLLYSSFYRAMTGKD